jgi:hypothetical protein
LLRQYIGFQAGVVSTALFCAEANDTVRVFRGRYQRCGPVEILYSDQRNAIPKILEPLLESR